MEPPQTTPPRRRIASALLGALLVGGALGLLVLTAAPGSAHTCYGNNPQISCGECLDDGHVHHHYDRAGNLYCQSAPSPEGDKLQVAKAAA